MTEVATPVLHVQIASALATLRGARANWVHSPNSHTELMVEQAERMLNYLLDQKARASN
jgi:hypothetical protein